MLLAHLGARTLILAGVAGDYCVLFTAQDAYMQGYRVVVPRDCVASEPDQDNEAALRHMEKVCKADTRPSTYLCRSWLYNGTRARETPSSEATRAGQ